MANSEISDNVVSTALQMESLIRGVYKVRHNREIQPLQWSIIRYLQRMPEKQCTTKKLAEFLGLTAAPVSRSLSSLNRKGLVFSRINPDDGRSSVYYLTEQGLEITTRDPILSIAHQLENLTQSERLQFENVLSRIALDQRATG